jgi:acyl-CoA synthetase (AMP-forming)/AMP-acid ligase II
MLNVIPLCHDMGLIGGVLGSFLERNPLIVVDTKWFLRSPVSVLELGMRRQVTVAPIPNFVVRYLTRILRLKSNAAPYFDTWKSIYIGSERITKETIEQFISVGARFALHPRSLIFSYGMAEAALMVTSYRFTNMAEAFDDEVDGSSHANNGMPLDGIEVEFGDAAGSYREIKVRGESLFSSSESPLERTSTWHHTGDVGYRKGGNLFIVGRIRDSITVDGTNVHAADVEEALSNEMAVEQCICEPIDGVLHVWLVTKRTDPVDAERVTRLLRRLFGISKSQVATIRPAQVARTTSGKIMKQVTVQRLLSASCTHVSHKPVCQEHTAA